MAQSELKRVDLTQMLRNIREAPVARMEVTYQKITLSLDHWNFSAPEHHYSDKFTINETGIAQYWPDFKKSFYATKIQEHASSVYRTTEYTWCIVLYDKYGNRLMSIYLSECVCYGLITTAKDFVAIDLGNWESTNMIKLMEDNMRSNRLLLWLSENFGEIFTYNRDVMKFMGEN